MLPPLKYQCPFDLKTWWKCVYRSCRLDSFWLETLRSPIRDLFPRSIIQVCALCSWGHKVNVYGMFDIFYIEKFPTTTGRKGLVIGLSSHSCHFLKQNTFLKSLYFNSSKNSIIHMIIYQMKSLYSFFIDCRFRQFQTCHNTVM